MSATPRRRRAALLTAPLVTVLVVGVGVLTSGFGRSDSESTARANLSGAVSTPSAASTPSASSTPAARAAVEARTLGTSRSTARVPLVNNRVPKAIGKRWTTGLLKLRVEPRAKGRTAGLLEEDRRVRVTGRTHEGYSEVLIKQTPRWVTAEYLSKKREVPEPRSAAVSSATDGAGVAPESAAPSTGLSEEPCPDGSSIESGLQPAAVKVYRAACAAFPELSTYGGQDGHGEHVNGQAIDFMVTDSSTGQRLADFLYAHHAELDLFDIIWAQRIWTIERSGEGFRSMSDRGSATANHFDHVHIMVN